MFETYVRQNLFQLDSMLVIPASLDYGSGGGQRSDRRLFVHQSFHFILLAVFSSLAPVFNLEDPIDVFPVDRAQL
jgi:hypothetical protein